MPEEGLTSPDGPNKHTPCTLHTHSMHTPCTPCTPCTLHAHSMLASFHVWGSIVGTALLSLVNCSLSNTRDIGIHEKGHYVRYKVMHWKCRLPSTHFQDNNSLCHRLWRVLSITPMSVSKCILYPHGREVYPVGLRPHERDRQPQGAGGRFLLKVP
jgi:hypothetical protein